MGNPIDFGKVRPGTTLYVPFPTYDSNDPTASSAATGLAVTDIEIYKNGSVTQRSSDAGYTLLDTDGLDFDGITGINGFSIDLADNTDSGFYVNGGQFWIVLSSITVDSGTVSFIPATFRIGYQGSLLDTTIATLSSQTSFTLTSGPSEDDALNGMWCILHDVASAVQCGYAVISDYTGSTKTVTLAAGTTFTAAAGDGISIMGPAPALSTVCTEARLSELDAGTVGKMANQVDEIRTDTEDIQSKIGTPAGASVSTDIAAVKSDSAAILDDTGTNGVVVAAGSKSGYSLAVDQSGVTIGTVSSATLANGAHGGAAATITLSDYSSFKATGFSTHSAADVKTAIEAAGSHLALILEDTGTTIPGTITTMQGNVTSILEDTGTTLQGKLDYIQAQIGTAGAGLTGIPWNASWDAEVQSECYDALNQAMPASPTGDSAFDYITRTKFITVNKMVVNETTGDTTVYKDDNTTAHATVSAAFTSVAGETIRLKLE